MGIAIDPSSPAAVGGNANGTITTAAFNPPADTWLVAIVAIDNNTTVTGSVTDNKGGGWSLVKRSNRNGAAEVWAKQLTDAQTGMTVSLTPTGGWSGLDTSQLIVQVLTGCGGIGNSVASTASNVSTVALAAQSVGSIVFGSLTYTTSSSPAAYVGNANTTSLRSNKYTNGGWLAMQFRSNGLTTSTSSVTYGATVAQANGQDIVAVEFLPLADAAPASKLAMMI